MEENNSLKRKHGRKSLEETDKRSINLKIRLKQNEYNIIRERMTILGFKKLSSYMRKMLLPDVYENIIKVSKEDKLIYEINKMGVNINQIAKRINSNQMSNLTKEELFYLKNIDTSLSKLLELFIVKS